MIFGSKILAIYCDASYEGPYYKWSTELHLPLVKVFLIQSGDLMVTFCQHTSLPIVCI